jgi:hypothetical protein
MVDIDAAIGFVVAHGDPVEKARVAWLRSGRAPDERVLVQAEYNQTASGGWAATSGSQTPSIDATCFHLAELDDLGALGRPAARRALAWLASRQQPDGTWEEDRALAGTAPPWAMPGDPEARLYLTTHAGFWLAVAGPPEPPPSEAATAHESGVLRAAAAFRSCVQPDGSWPSFLVAGWYGAALLQRTGWFYEAAMVQLTLEKRVNELGASDVASIGAVLRRVGVSSDDRLLVSVRQRLGVLQRSDGGWISDDGPAFDVHTTLTAIRAAH